MSQSHIQFQNQKNKVARRGLREWVGDYYSFLTPTHSTLKDQTLNIRLEVVMIMRFIERILDYFVQPFPSCYPPESFDCDEGNCEGCKIWTRWKD